MTICGASNWWLCTLKDPKAVFIKRLCRKKGLKESLDDGSAIKNTAAEKPPHLLCLCYLFINPFGQIKHSNTVEHHLKNKPAVERHFQSKLRFSIPIKHNLADLSVNTTIFAKSRMLTCSKGVFWLSDLSN